MSFWDDVRKVFTGKGLGPSDLGRKIQRQGTAMTGINNQSRRRRSRKNNDPDKGMKAWGTRYSAQDPNKGNRAWGQRYQKQADVAGVKRGPKNWPGMGSGGGGGGDVGGYDDGSSALQEALNQIGSMRTPDVEIPQIDVVKTLAALFDPQFQSITQAKERTKYQGSKNVKEIKAAYKALEKSIDTEDAAEIKKSYKEATKENDASGKAAEKSMTNAMKAQAAERRKDAENLGIETALAQDSSAQTELAKGLADAAKSTKDQNSRLAELKKSDEVLNRDAAQTAQFQGNESVSALKSQVAEILAGYEDRWRETLSAKGNKRLELETQNQNAVLAGKEAQAKEAQQMMETQADILKNAQDMGLESAKLQSNADIELAKINQKRYDTDAKADRESRSSSNKNASVLDQLVALRPGGLGAKSIQGVISNMDSFYAKGKGTWADAYREYAKTYSKSERSKSAAREYLRLMGKR